MLETFLLRSFLVLCTSCVTGLASYQITPCGPGGGNAMCCHAENLGFGKTGSLWFPFGTVGNHAGCQEEPWHRIRSCGFGCRSWWTCL